MDFPDFKPQTKKDVLSLIESTNRAQTLEQAKETLPDWLYQYIDAQVKQKKFSYEDVTKDIKLYLNSLKEIKIYLPFEPSRNLIEKIMKQFDDKDSKRYLDIVVDENIVGGVKIVIDGKIYDESLDSFIDKKLAA